MKKILIVAAVCAAFLLLLNWAGRNDHDEQVLYTMPNDTYKAIKDSLHTDNVHEIVKFYVKNY